MIKKVKVTNSIKFVTLILSYFQIGQVYFQWRVVDKWQMQFRIILKCRY
jgi:hypothetical protein